jgi:hypothetical protein
MSLSRLHHRGAALSLVAAAFLAACSGQSNNAFVPTQSAPFASHTAQGPTDFMSMPAACIGQKNSKDYATLDATFSTKGGTVCIPAFGGWGGSVTYPPAEPAAKVALTSSVKNYNKMPNFDGSAAMFYLQVTFKSPTGFGTKAPAGGGLIGKTLVPGKTYSAVAGASLLGKIKILGGCTAVATKTSSGGSISGLGTVLQGAPIAIAPITGIVEIYPGKSKFAKGKC